MESRDSTLRVCLREVEVADFVGGFLVMTTFLCIQYAFC